MRFLRRYLDNYLIDKLLYHIMFFSYKIDAKNIIYLLS